MRYFFGEYICLESIGVILFGKQVRVFVLISNGVDFILQLDPQLLRNRRFWYSLCAAS